MTKNEYLEIVAKQIAYIFDIPVITKELGNHIDDFKENLMNEGYNLDEDEKLSIEMMGDSIEAGKQLNKIHNPLLGYMLMLARIVVLIILCSLLTTSLSVASNTMEMMSPIVFEYSDQVYEVDKEVYFPTYKLIIDNICKTYHDNYVLTYHCNKDIAYLQYHFEMMQK